MSTVLSRAVPHWAGEAAGAAAQRLRAPDGPAETEPHHARRPAARAAWPAKEARCLQPKKCSTWQRN